MRFNFLLIFIGFFSIHTNIRTNLCGTNTVAFSQASCAKFISSDVGIVSNRCENLIINKLSVGNFDNFCGGRSPLGSQREFTTYSYGTECAGEWQKYSCSQ